MDSNIKLYLYNGIEVVTIRRMSKKEKERIKAYAERLKNLAKKNDEPHPTK